MKVNNNLTNVKLKKNQINICSALYNNPNHLISQGFMPVRLLNCIENNISISQLSKEAENLINQIKNESYGSTLKLQSSKEYIVYDLDYYDILNNEKINVLEQSIIYMDLKGKDVKVDTENYFVYNFDYDYQREELVEFNLDSYNKALQDVKSNTNNILCYCTVLLQDNMDFYTFIKTSKFKEMRESNYWIQSNETIHWMKEAVAYDACKDNVKLFSIISVVALFMFNFYIVLNGLTNERKIISFRNYGFMKDDIYRSYIECYAGKFFNIVMAVLVLLTNFKLLYDTNQWNIIIYYMYSLGFIATQLLSNRWKTYYIKRQVHRIFTIKFNMEK